MIDYKSLSQRLKDYGYKIIKEEYDEYRRKNTE